MSRGNMLGKALLHIDRAMSRSRLFARSSIRIEIDREALAAPSASFLREADDGYGVPAAFSRFEYDTSVERWPHFNDLIALEVPRVRVQANGAAPTRIPILVQVDDCIQPTMLSGDRVNIEIAMRIQTRAGKIFVSPSSKI